MQVGDLVRHQMYNELKAPAVVLKIDDTRNNNVFRIKIFDPDDGIATWDFGRDYEVISETR